MKIKSICFLAGIYPTEKFPHSGVFYKNLVDQFADFGIDCRVIYPYPINYPIDRWDKQVCYYTKNNNKVIIYRPPSITFGAKNLQKMNTARLTALTYSNSAINIFNKLNWTPDALYGHFISPAGFMTSRLSSITNIPGFIAYGESSPWSIETMGVKYVKESLKNIKGYISVSEVNKKELLNYGLTDDKKIGVFPNGVDFSVFYKRNKEEARKILGWDQNIFIAAFAGSFDNRKGVLRVDKAVKDMKDVYLAYGGKGNMNPKNGNIIFKGIVSPEKMPWFLSAADIFVLPTLNEGCCNAIIEALACGLPVISSDRDFNHKILSDKNSILIDPESIDQIRTSIYELKTNEKLREALGKGAIAVSQKFDIKERCLNIIKWMESRI